MAETYDQWRDRRNARLKDIRTYREDAKARAVAAPTAAAKGEWEEEVKRWDKIEDALENELDAAAWANLEKRLKAAKAKRAPAKKARAKKKGKKRA